jgi:hypothetical protein
MSMDRLRRVLAGGMLAIMLGTVVAASGCRSTRNEVPPGPKYSTTGEPSSSVGFNSAPHPYVGTGSPYANSPIPGQPGMPGSAGPGGAAADGLPIGSGGAPSSFGTPPPGSANLGAPTNNAFGAPGTSGAYTGR